MKYLPRATDAIVGEKLLGLGGLVIVGPKWCGKTSTAQQFANSALYLDDSDAGNNNIQIASLNPSLLGRNGGQAGEQTGGRSRRQSPWAGGPHRCVKMRRTGLPCHSDGRHVSACAKRWRLCDSYRLHGTLTKTAQTKTQALSSKL